MLLKWLIVVVAAAAHVSAIPVASPASQKEITEYWAKRKILSQPCTLQLSPICVGYTDEEIHSSSPPTYQVHRYGQPSIQSDFLASHSTLIVMPIVRAPPRSPHEDVDAGDDSLPPACEPSTAAEEEACNPLFCQEYTIPRDFLEQAEELEWHIAQGRFGSHELPNLYALIADLRAGLEPAAVYQDGRRLGSEDEVEEGHDTPTILCLGGGEWG
ncbi:hypothetical protein Dda_0696 [Drechslerella dactyloides]|uniref:Uncharacterized protein n=1 Tax=Drechslerella dactyloides TaxID=74499 RepID=A0AAD6NMW1_DREDA|nr:hypothetical protein Dda_0696 [Drechslerella dactyloides]